MYLERGINEKSFYLKYIEDKENEICESVKLLHLYFFIEICYNFNKLYEFFVEN